MYKIICQTINAKVCSQEGNSPDCILKFLNIINSKNLIIKYFTVGKIRSSYPIMKA